MADAYTCRGLSFPLLPPPRALSVVPSPSVSRHGGCDTAFSICSTLRASAHSGGRWVLRASSPSCSAHCIHELPYKHGLVGIEVLCHSVVASPSLLLPLLPPHTSKIHHPPYRQMPISVEVGAVPLASVRLSLVSLHTTSSCS